MHSRSAHCPTKKHKESESCDDVSANSLSTFSNFASSAHHDDKNYTPQLYRMEQMMMRMDEKLDIINSLESRCEQLEIKCSSLENKLSLTSQLLMDHVDKKFDHLHVNLEKKCNNLQDRSEGIAEALHEKIDKAQKYHEYNAMLLRSQSWEYSADVETYDWLDDDEEASYKAETAAELKDETIRMRRGEFPFSGQDRDDVSDYGIYLYSGFNRGYDSDDLAPHLKEFIAAIRQFTPAMNMLSDHCESVFEYGFVNLNSDMQTLLKEALIEKPFKRMIFSTERNMDESSELCVDDIITIVGSNKHLQKLELISHHIRRDHIERLCSVVINQQLLELSLSDISNDSGVGNAILSSLLTSDELQLEKLSMIDCNITSDVSRLLANFISMNRSLIELRLDGNTFNDSDAALIANSLRHNSTLRLFKVAHNNITDGGFETFRPVLFDESSLNTAAYSNHCCFIPQLGPHRNFNLSNAENAMEVNRGKKIYSILSRRHLHDSNAQYFSEIDVKILPDMLEAVQKYSIIGGETEDEANLFESVRGLSIIYEVMRRWEKVFALLSS